jgi:hypothetical protein
MKTVDQIFQQLFETIEEWRPCDPEADSVKEIIAAIQKEAFEEGWIQGLGYKAYTALKKSSSSEAIPGP